MQPKPFNYERPDWKPLERAVLAAGLPPETCGQFMWMFEDPQGVHHYKNRDTRGYVVLTPDADNETAAARVRTWWTKRGPHEVLHYVPRSR